MVEQHEEIEMKYELSPEAELPPLGSLLPSLRSATDPVAELHVGDLGEVTLEAVYFDTADLRLSAAKTTLRRRTGGSDAGWHLKTPSGGDDGGDGGGNGARLEQRVPLGRAVRTVPIALRRLVEDLSAGQRLVPVAQLSTRRRVQTVLDATGRRLLELADDTVEARRLLPATGGGATAADHTSAGTGADAAGAVQSWREIELELLDGDREVFDALDTQLRAAGLSVSTSSSKLARVLAAATTETPDDPAQQNDSPAATTATNEPAREPALGEEVQSAAGRVVNQPRTLTPSAFTPSSTSGKKVTAKSKAGDVLFLHLREQVQQIFDQDSRVRADEADSVHKMRVATRRLRSALRTFQPLLSGPTKPLRDELRWLATELGQARDAEVLRDRLVEAVTSLDVAPNDRHDAHQDQPAHQAPDQTAELAATGAIPQQVADQLGIAYRRAHDEVLTELDSQRYQHLLDTLQDFVQTPPVSSRAGRAAGKELPKRVAKTYRALAALVQAAREAPVGPERDELFHEARKAAKQVRYAAEAVAVVFGKDAKRFASAVTDVQEVLGEHQDSVVTRERLTELAGQASPEVAFAYGRLYAQEQAHAVSTEVDFDDVWDAVQAKRLHRWLQ